MERILEETADAIIAYKLLPDLHKNKRADTTLFVDNFAKYLSAHDVVKRSIFTTIWAKFKLYGRRKAKY